MMKMIAVVLFLVTAGAEAPATDFTLELHRAGIVRVGENVDVLYRAVNGQAQLVDLKAEGDFTPLLKLTIDGRNDALRAFIGASDRQLIVRAIDVRDPRFRTAAGIHVGSTLGELRKTYGRLERIGGEGTVGARVESLAMTFDLGGDVYGDDRYRARDLSDMPDDIPIVRIWVN
jgi:hypothetical protein